MINDFVNTLEDPDFDALWDTAIELIEELDSDGTTTSRFRRKYFDKVIRVKAVETNLERGFEL